MRGGRAAIVLLLLIAFLAAFETNAEAELYREHTIAQYIEFGEIWIDTDADFIGQSWPGNGSISNPLVISGLSVPRIVILNTRVHFVINNCLIQNGEGVFFFNVTNGVFTNNRLVDSHEIELFNSSHFQVAYNNLQNCIGIDCDGSNYTIIENNIVAHPSTAISLRGSSHNIVRNNTLYRSRYRGISIQHFTHYGTAPSSNNSIYYNRIGCAQFDIAYDDGESNIWDDNVSRGNSWYGYDGSGVVSIAGSAGSIDRYPSTFDIDCEGPEMTYTFYNRTSPEGTPPFPSFTYEVSVEDPSGVDTVLLFYRVYVGGGGSIPPFPETVVVEMEHQPTVEDPNRYTYTVAGPLYGISPGHYYWANDTLDNSAESQFDRIDFGPDKSYYDTMFYTQSATILAISVFFILALVYLISYRMKQTISKKQLQKYSVRYVMPVLAFLFPYSTTIQFTPYFTDISLLGAGYISSFSGRYGMFGSIVGITTTELFFSPFLLLVLGIHLPFFISMSRYYDNLTSKRQAQLVGFALFILLPLIMNFFSGPYISPTYFSLTLVLPFPIVYVFGLLLMRYFPRTERESIETE